MKKRKKRKSRRVQINIWIVKVTPLSLLIFLIILGPQSIEKIMNIIDSIVECLT